MGTSCRISIPGEVGDFNILRALGLLMGGTPFFGVAGTVTRLEVNNIDIKPVKGDDTLVWLIISKPPEGAGLFDWKRDDKISALLHYEWEVEDHYGLMPRSTPLWVALGRALVDLFGGSISYDEEGDGPHYQKPPTGKYTDEEILDTLLSIKPLTKEQVGAARPFAAYQQD